MVMRALKDGEIVYDEAVNWTPEDIKNLTADNFPNIEWIKENLKGKSNAIRYLHSQHNGSVKAISQHLGIPYRHVYNVVSKFKRLASQLPPHICPVCMNRKPPTKKEQV